MAFFQFLKKARMPKKGFDPFCVFLQLTSHDQLIIGKNGQKFHDVAPFIHTETLLRSLGMLVV